MEESPANQEVETACAASGGEELTRSVYRNGCYENPWSTWRPIEMARVVKFYLKGKDNSNIPCEAELDKTLPIETPNFDDFAQSPGSGVRVMWVGHATVLVQFDHVTILTDPVFSNRCSPLKIFGPKRYRRAPCSVDDLPHLDAVVISHNHYDHLDYASVNALNRKYGQDLRWYVPLGLKSWFVASGCSNITEMDWWDEVEHRVDADHTVKFVCTPCQHWSKRTAFDSNKILWCSWAVIGPSHSFYFGGDTGYCDVFKQIGRKYGPFSLAALPIGAYEPRWFMQPQHVNPQESVQIHEDLNSRLSVGIHWGTFNLTHEAYLEPRTLLWEELQRKNLDNAEFITVRHGRVAVLGGNGFNMVD